MQLTHATPAPNKPAMSSDTLLPPEMRKARIGKGTVGSEIDRSIRVRFEGDGPIESRKLIPDSEYAKSLFQTEDGATLERAIKAFASTVDSHQGNENLKTVTLIPDEHASKGISILNWADSVTAKGQSVSSIIEPSKSDLDRIAKTVPKYSRSQVREELRRMMAASGVKQLTDAETENVAFAGAWNSNGHIVLMPDVSRDFLSTIGLYRIQPGDQTQLRPVERRKQAGKWAWDTALHETHHSISPIKSIGPEWTSVMEESVPEVLSPGGIRTSIAKAGADLNLTARPARDTKNEAVNWPAWNKLHLPKPPKSQVNTAKGRYTDGPELLRELLRVAGIDRRTNSGKKEALKLLQTDDASRVPRRVADKIAERYHLLKDHTEQLANLIRQAAVGKSTINEIKEFIEDNSGAATS